MASEAVKRQRAVRRRMFRRTMVASLALFMAIFTLMAGQMALGHDPAVGAKKPQAPQQVAQVPPANGSWKEAAGQAVGAVIGNVISNVAEGDDDDDEHGGAPSQQQSAPSQSAPAPVQTGAS